jgi:hypothetical protein
MLRYVALRIEQEARVLTEDINEISMLLKRIATYLDSTIAPAATAESLRISESLAWASLGQATYTSVSSLVERAAAMNEALDSSLRYLQSIRSTHRGNTAYDEIRIEIRRYLRWQIEHEAQLVHPAFEGFGPRR